MNKKIRWIVETAIFLALLLILQTVTKPFGTIVTGSTVNFVLIAATLMTGMSSGLIVAIVSPFLALVLGIVPLPIYFVPAIAFGNAILVLAYGLILRKANKENKKLWQWIVALVVSSVAKFLALYVSVLNIVVPIMTAVKGVPAKAPAAIFSVQQMLTAAIGGVLAILVVPAVNKARRK